MPPREPASSSLRAGNVPNIPCVAALQTATAVGEDLRRLGGFALGAFVEEPVPRLGDERLLHQIDPGALRTTDVAR